MLNSEIKNVKIKGISTVAPKNSVSLLDNPNLYNGNQDKIKRVIESSGFKYRRVADEKTTTSDLCFEAAQDLIKGLNIEKSSIDGIVFVSTTPDYFMPPSSCILHNKLGLKDDCAMFDINHACTGFVYGVWVTSMMLNANLKRVLLLVGDTFNKYTDMFDNNTAPVFGDAGSAVLLDYDENASPMYFDIGSQTSGYDAIFCQNGGFRNPPTLNDFDENGKYKYNSSMDGMKVFKFTSEKIPQSIKNVLEFSNNSIDDIDFCVLHQANKFILKNIADMINLPLEKMPMDTISKYGNQVSASIPGAICNCLSDAMSKEKKTILMSGFGVGLTWMSCIMELDKIYCSQIIDYKGGKNE